ncbi:SCO family protein [Sphingomonas sp.]|jgi:protein SCO1/2|uniref:SCO family protein n=1 Tax=Sphingomonas sp. TaxID=28214 RepID=UPI0035C79F8D
MNMRIRAVAIALFSGLLLTAPLAGCSRTPAETPPLAGARIGGPFTLTDQHGRTVTDRDFAGRYRIVYFGYTFCPDVCPVDVQNLSAALKLVEAKDPALGRRIVPIFISVDPARDTPAVLRQFAAAFHPRLVALTGSADAIARTAKAYGIYYRRGAGTADGYMVDHSRQIYLFDPDGKPLALLPEGPPQAIADELTKWAH